MSPRLRAARRGLLTAPVALALLVAAACGTTTSGAARYSAQRTDGTKVTVASLRGRPALLTSWATWCTECAELLPGLERLAEQQGTDGVEVVAVNVDRAGDAAKVAETERKYGMTMPRWRDPDDEFTHVFRARGVPTSVLLDSSGKVVRTWPGGFPLDDPAARRLLRRTD